MTEVQQLIPVTPPEMVLDGTEPAEDLQVLDLHSSRPAAAVASMGHSATGANNGEACSQAETRSATAAGEADADDGGPTGAATKVLRILLKTDTIGGKMPLPDPSTDEGADMDYDPGMHPKSCPGVICSNLWLLVYIGLVCVCLWRLVDPDNVGAVAGDESWLWFNHHCAETGEELAKMLALDDRPVIKLPTFKVRIDAQLTQFEEDSPSLQKVEVIDDTGYTRHPITSHLAPIPGVKSVVKKMKLPLNGFGAPKVRTPHKSPAEACPVHEFVQCSDWGSTSVTPTPAADGRLSRVPPRTPVPADDVDSTFARAAAHRFTSETLKARYQELGIFEAGQHFYPHTAHLFARLGEERLPPPDSLCILCSEILWVP